MTSKLTEKQGAFLLNLARETITDKLKAPGKKDADIIVPEKDKDTISKKKRGVFITLHKDHELRGCIGTIEAARSIVEGVKYNALNAAFHDPRFSPVTKNELEKINIEVSILTKPVKIKYDNTNDLIDKITPFQDGVIIKKKNCSATFLPQVWDQLPDCELFLSHLCRKAGLKANEWQKNDLEVSLYQVQYFNEE